MIAILRRELNSYFSSAIGYVYLAVFFFFLGMFFCSLVLGENSSDISPVFGSMNTIIMLIIPILTMRLMSEDKRQKTDQALFTAPVGLNSVVYGKYLAALVVYAIGVAMTLVFAIVMSAFAKLNWSIVFGNILGMLLLGAAIISIGLFISSITESQVIAAIGTFAVMIVFLYIDSIAGSIPIKFLSDTVSSISFTARSQEFTTGVLSIPNVIYFLSAAVIFNFITLRFLEKKRWS